MSCRVLSYAAVAIGCALGASAAATPQRALANVGGCEAARAFTLIGQAAPDDATARSITGAKIVRRVAPGSAATLDYRPNRVTLEIESGRVIGTRCG